MLTLILKEDWTFLNTNPYSFNGTEDIIMD